MLSRNLYLEINLHGCTSAKRPHLYLTPKYAIPVERREERMPLHFLRVVQRATESPRGVPRQQLLIGVGPRPAPRPATLPSVRSFRCPARQCAGPCPKPNPFQRCGKNRGVWSGHSIQQHGAIVTQVTRKQATNTNSAREQRTSERDGWRIFTSLI